MVCSDQPPYVDSPLSERDKEECSGHCQNNTPCTNKGRRSFLKMSLGTLAVFWGGLTTIPFIKYLTSGTEDTQSVAISQVTVGPVSDFAVGTSKNFQFGNTPALLIRNLSGDFKAFNAVCTHLGCTVQYSSEEKNIWCACHGGQFDASTGENIAGPPPKPLTPLVANVVEGVVIVSRT